MTLRPCLFVLGVALLPGLASAQTLPPWLRSAGDAATPPSRPAAADSSVRAESAWPLIGAALGAIAGYSLTAFSDPAEFYLTGAIGIGLGAHWGNRSRGNALVTLGGSLAVLGIAVLLSDLEHPPDDLMVILPITQIGLAIMAELATTPPRRRT